MAKTYNLSDLMNNIKDMSTVVSTVKTSGSTSASIGLGTGGFYFNGNGWVSRIKISYDGSVIFNYNDTSTDYTVFSLFNLEKTKEIYRLYGTLENGAAFVKLRVHGSTSSASTYSEDAVYEFFLIGKISDTQPQICINLIKVPNTSILRYYYNDSKVKAVKLPAAQNVQSKIWLTRIGTDATQWSVKTDKTLTLNDLLGNDFYTESHTNYSSETFTNYFDWFKIGNALMASVQIQSKGRVALQKTGNIIELWGTSSSVKTVSLSFVPPDVAAGLQLSDNTYVYKLAGKAKIPSSSSTSTLEFEVYFFSNQKILVYIISAPDADSNATGNNYISLNGIKTTIGDTTNNKKIWVYLDENGMSYAVKTGNDSEISKIEILTLPTNNKFYEGSKLDLTGLTVRATFSDGEVFDIPKLDDTNVNYTNKAGTQTVTVTFRGKTATFQTECLEDVVTEITPSMVDHYLLNESISISSITVKWGTGKVEHITEGYTVSGFDSSTPGTQEVQISYKGTTVTKSVYVSETAALKLSEEYQTQYYIGDELRNPTVYVVYDDGVERTVSATFSGFDSTKAGDCIITVSAKGLNTTYTVNVADTYSVNIGSPTETDVVARLDLTTGQVTISGTGNTKEISTPNRGEGGLFNAYSFNSKIKTVVVEEGVTGLCGACFYEITTLTEIALPSTLTLIGENCFYQCTGCSEIVLPEAVSTISRYAFYGCADMTVSILNKNAAITESNGSASTLPVKLIKGYLGSTAETYAKKFNIPFQILDKITKLDVVNNRGTYHIGEVIGDADLTVKVTLEDGTVQETSSYDIEYDFSTVGTKVVTVSLGGQSTSFNATVIAYTLSEMIGTTDGMMTVRNNSKNDDGTDTVQGVSWFKFNGVAADKIYINGNNWIGFGTSSEQLKICRRDGAVYSVYRLETTLSNGTKVLKLRVEGYTRYDDTGSYGTDLKYELFLFDTGDMYLHVIQSPAASGSYAGTSSLTSGGNTTTLNLTDATPDKPVEVTFVHQDDSGINWDVKYAKYSFGEITGIEITTLPDKTAYRINGEFDPSGLVVSAVYSDDTKTAISDYEISSPDMSQIGKQTVTVTYEKFSATFEIEIFGVTGIEITNMPDKTEYAHGESLDATGLEVSEVYGDGSTEIVSDYTLSGFDSSKAGKKNVTVTYKTYSTTFTVDVYGEVSGIRISRYPDKYYYAIGEKLDTTGLEVVVQFEDGSETALFNNTDLEFTGFSSKKVGTKKVRCMTNIVIGNTLYLGEDWFHVCVTNDAKNPFAGDPEPIDIRVHWINGEFKDLVNENLQFGATTLQESLCNENYFIYGGCVSNQITFKTYHKQFVSTDDSSYPSGKIEVYIKRKNTELKIFTGEIASGERDSGMLTRTIIAYDYLYKWRNTDISSWYKSQTTDKGENVLLTQKQFRDLLFKYLGIVQVETKLEYDNAYVPNTNIPNELNLATVIKDLCFQNSVFGWMNRDGEFEYIKVKKNSKPHYPRPESEPLKYDYFQTQIHIDKFKSFRAQEGRIWGPKRFWPDPYPGVFSDGGYTAQEAYELNVCYNKNSFFIGDQDWLDKAFEADEYGYYTTANPAFPICYGPSDIIDIEPQYRAQGYTAEVEGNPFNMIGDTIQMKNVKYAEDGSEVIWLVNSYIMSRTLKIGATMLLDTYSASNAPYNGETRQLGKKPYQFSQSDLPTISYSSTSAVATNSLDAAVESSGINKATLRCMKQISKAAYDALVAAGADRKDTLYFTYEED